MTPAPAPAATVWRDLGPATEALFRTAFAQAATVTARCAARLVGLDEKTFGALVEARAIRCVRVSTATRRFTEADLRAWLGRETELELEPKPCPSTNRRKAASGSTTSRSGASGFTDRPARLRVVQPRP